MSSAAIKAGAAFVEIFARDKTKAGVNTAQSSLKSFASGLAGAAAMVSSVIAGISSSAVIGAMSAAVKTFADTGSAINDMAARTGVGVQSLQQFKFAAEQTGASLSDVEKALRHMAKHGKSVGDFEALGQQIASIQDPSERSAAAMEAFGKSGTMLLPMFQEWKALKEASSALGPIMTADEVARADQLGDAFGALNEAATRASQQIGDTMAPALQKALDVAIGLTAEFAKWAQENKGQNQSFVNGALAGMLGPLGKFGSKSLSALGKKGREATADKSAAGAFVDEDEIKSQEEHFKKQAEGFAKALDAIGQGVETAKKHIDEFKTPAEKFADKMKEMEQSIAMVNKARVLGMLTDEEAGKITQGLKTAMARATAEEMQKRREQREGQVKQIIGGLMTPLEKFRQQLLVVNQALQQERDPNKRKELGIAAGRLREAMREEASKFTSETTRGTFSARGAGLLGLGTTKIMTDATGKVIVQRLDSVVIELGKAIPKFR
jgi:hypothetical protein